MGISRNQIRVSAALLFALFSGSLGFADTVRPAPAAEVLNHIRIGNFGVVNDHVYRGAQPKGHDYADLASSGVKTVIDLQADGPENEGALVQHAGMRYVRIPMYTSDPPTRAQVAEFFKVMNDAASQPVFVHCAGGKHRTGTMIAIYRMTNDGWTADQAYREMKQYHFETFISHPALKKFVFAFKPGPTQPVVATTIIPGQ
jgi:protein tyrosine/serine phosphatase